MKNKDKLLSVEHLKVGLKERSVKSAGITVFAQGIKLVLQLASIAILARLLEPADFGLVAMVTIFTGLAAQLLDGGLSMATIQRDQVTHAQVSNLFWINFMLSIALCISGIVAAPLVATVYNEPRLTMIMVVVSLSFIIGGISVQHDAILRRQMRFKAISIIDTMSLVIGLIAGVVSAVAGLKYWALIVSPIITALTATIMRWATTRWIPSMLSRGSGVRPMLNFGANLTGAGFVGYISMNMTSFSVGFIGGAQSLGLFNRANTISSLPMNQLLPSVMNVIQPAMSRVADDPIRFRKIMIPIMGKIAIGTMLVTTIMVTMADWIVLLFLGSGWENAVLFFQALAIYSLVQPIASFLAASLIASGNARALFRFNIFVLFVIGISIATGSMWGVSGIVYAYSLSGLMVRLPIFLYYTSRLLPVTFLEMIKTLMTPLFCSILAGLVILSLRDYMAIASPIRGLIIFTPIAVISFLFFCMLFKHTRAEIKEAYALLAILFKK